MAPKRPQRRCAGLLGLWADDRRHRDRRAVARCWGRLPTASGAADALDLAVLGLLCRRASMAVVGAARAMPTLFWPVFWFGLGFIGMEFATIFTNALMPDLTGADEIGHDLGLGLCLRLSGRRAGADPHAAAARRKRRHRQDADRHCARSSGWTPTAREGTRAVGPFTAIWYVVFMIPFFLWVREPQAPAAAARCRSAGAWPDLVRNAAAACRIGAACPPFLASSMFYRDALNAHLRASAASMPSGVLGWSVTQIGIFGILAAITGGDVQLARRPGGQRALARSR